MKIHNVRLGHATNSSSTHSIVLLGKDNPARDSFDRGSFGWSHFTCRTPDAKMIYLATTAYSELEQFLDSNIALAVVKDLFGIELDPCDGVDHQSLISLPRTWDGQALNTEFLSELQNYLLQERITILGGNDNDDGEHPLLSSSEPISINLPTDSYSYFVARRDGEHWTLFNRTTGAKMRISFNDDAKEYVRADLPELIDVKITDFCDKGCDFCYEDSTPNGKHADPSYLRDLAHCLEGAEVFEVALGGGEPTKHPEFKTILQYFASAHINVSFSTGSFDWLTDNSWRKILKRVSAFGFSVGTSGRAFDRMLGYYNSIIKDELNIPPELVAHVVMGTVTEDEFLSILEKCDRHHVPMLLLGYKNIGRAKRSHQFIEYRDWWLNAITQDSYCHIGIDTVLAQRHVKDLEKIGVSNRLYTTLDGNFSMFVDAVHQKAGVSSYGNKRKQIDFKDPYQARGLKTVFHSFREGMI